MKRLCGICGAEFVPPKKNRPGLFCSARCRNTNNARVSVERRAAAQRGTGTLWYVKDHGVHAHRRVAETMLGRPMQKGEVVHHKDGNKKNNSPDNLITMSQREHMLEHGLGVPGVTPSHKPWLKRRNGQDAPFSKLTNEIILDIRDRVARGQKQKDAGAIYGVKQSYVSQIVRRVRWSHLP